MIKILHDIISFYQTETTFKIFGIIAIILIPIIFLAISLYGKAKLVRGRFTKHTLRKYYLAQAKRVTFFLVFGGFSHLIAHPLCYKGSDIVIPLWLVIANAILNLVALYNLISLEAGFAAAMYAIINLPLIALLDKCIDDTGIINAINLLIVISTLLIIGIYCSTVGDISAQKYLHIKTTSDLEKSIS